MEVIARVSLEELERLYRVEKDAAKAIRIRMVILAMQGFTAPSISMCLGPSRRIVQQWVYRFNAEGLAGLEDGRGHTSRLPLSGEQVAALEQRLATGPVESDGVCSLRGRDLRTILAEEFQLVRSLSAVYYLLHRLGYSCLRPRPRHRRADPAVQAEFQRELPQRLATIAAQHPQRRLRVYFQDEARFGQQGTLTNVWAKRGSRPTVVRQTEYEYLWVLGAVCPETGHAEGLLSSTLNTEVVNEFLRQFARSIPADEQAVMIWDGAGFHTSHQLQVPENVTLISLPAYSPELNPIENLWHYLRSHYWSNRVYQDYDDLEHAAIVAWQNAALNPEIIRSVCAASYLNRAGSD
jgi:transposase